MVNRCRMLSWVGSSEKDITWKIGITCSFHDSIGPMSVS